MALTATATPDVRKDVLDTLRMRRPAKFVVSFFRPNLVFKWVHGNWEGSLGHCWEGEIDGACRWPCCRGHRPALHHGRRQPGLDCKPF